MLDGGVCGAESILRPVDDTSSTAERVDESAARGSLLEEIADGVPLSLRLEHLVRSVEQLAPGVVGSLLLISDGQLRVAAAPSLPEGYHRIADHQLIAGETAAHRRETVIASDLQTDPRWKNYRDVARAYGLGACWSAPILNRRQEVVGTLALYSREPRRPREEELAVIREFSALAAVTIDRKSVV